MATYLPDPSGLAEQDEEERLLQSRIPEPPPQVAEAPPVVEEEPPAQVQQAAPSPAPSPEEDDEEVAQMVKRMRQSEKNREKARQRGDEERLQNMRETQNAIHAVRNEQERTDAVMERNPEMIAVDSKYDSETRWRAAVRSGKLKFRASEEDFPEIDPEGLSAERLAKYQEARQDAIDRAKNESNWRYGVSKTPFLGGGKEFLESSHAMMAAMRIRDGKPRRDDFLVAARSFGEAEAREDWTTIGKFGDALLSLVPYAVEIGLTSGAYTAARKAATASLSKGGKAVAGKIAKEAMKEGVEDVVEKSIKKRTMAHIKGSVIGGAKMTMRNPQMVLKSAADKGLMDVISSDEFNFSLKARREIEEATDADDDAHNKEYLAALAMTMPRAFAKTQAELTSEMMGGDIKAMVKFGWGEALSPGLTKLLNATPVGRIFVNADPAKRGKMIKRSMLARVFKRGDGSPLGKQVKKLQEAVGFHGLLEEMSEETANDLFGMASTGIEKTTGLGIGFGEGELAGGTTGKMIKGLATMDLEMQEEAAAELLFMAGVLAVPAGGFRAGRALADIPHNLQNRREQEIRRQAREFYNNKDNREAVQGLIKTFSSSDGTVSRRGGGEQADLGWTEADEISKGLPNYNGVHRSIFADELFRVELSKTNAGPAVVRAVSEGRAIDEELLQESGMEQPEGYVLRDGEYLPELSAEQLAQTPDGTRVSVVLRADEEGGQTTEHTGTLVTDVSAGAESTIVPGEGPALQAPRVQALDVQTEDGVERIPLGGDNVLGMWHEPIAPEDVQPVAPEAPELAGTDVVEHVVTRAGEPGAISGADMPSPPAPVMPPAPGEPIVAAAPYPPELEVAEETVAAAEREPMETKGFRRSATKQDQISGNVGGTDVALTGERGKWSIATEGLEFVNEEAAATAKEPFESIPKARKFLSENLLPSPEVSVAVAAPGAPVGALSPTAPLLVEGFEAGSYSGTVGGVSVELKKGLTSKRVSISKASLEGLEFKTEEAKATASKPFSGKKAAMDFLSQNLIPAEMYADTFKSEVALAPAASLPEVEKAESALESDTDTAVGGDLTDEKVMTLREQIKAIKARLAGPTVVAQRSVLRNTLGRLRTRLATGATEEDVENEGEARLYDVAARLANGENPDQLEGDDRRLHEAFKKRVEDMSEDIKTTGLPKPISKRVVPVDKAPVSQDMVDRLIEILPFSNEDIKTSSDGREVTIHLGSGAVIRLEHTGDTEVDRDRVRASFPVGTSEAKIQAAEILGQWQLVKPNGETTSGLGVVQLKKSLVDSKGKLMEETVWHEMVHAARGFGLWNKKQWNALKQKYAADAEKYPTDISQEEAIARGIGASLASRKSLWSRFKKFLSRMIRAVLPGDLKEPPADLAEALMTTREFWSSTGVEDAAYPQDLTTKRLAVKFKSQAAADKKRLDALENLRRWNKDNKTVDEKGDPLRVYRGDIDAVKVKDVFKIIEVEDGGSGGIFTTTSKEQAEGYKTKELPPEMGSYIAGVPDEIAYATTRGRFEFMEVWEDEIDEEMSHDVSRAINKFAPDIAKKHGLSDKSRAASREKLRNQELHERLGTSWEELRKNKAAETEFKQSMWDALQELEFPEPGEPTVTELFMKMKNPIRVAPDPLMVGRFQSADLILQTVPPLQRGTLPSELEEGIDQLGYGVWLLSADVASGTKPRKIRGVGWELLQRRVEEARRLPEYPSLLREVYKERVAERKRLDAESRDADDHRAKRKAAKKLDKVLKQLGEIEGEIAQELHSGSARRAADAIEEELLKMKDINFGGVENSLRTVKQLRKNESIFKLFPEFREAAERAGYDGIVDGTQADRGKVVHIGFKSENVKNVENTGTFGEDDPRHMYAARLPNEPSAKEAFRRWFSWDWANDKPGTDRSVAVGDDGEPLVMYHGTWEDFESFEPEEEGMIYLSTDPGFAATFAGSRYGAKTIPVYVSATNVADYRNPDHVQKMREWYEEKGLGKPLGIENGDYEVWEKQAFLEHHGFDGVWLREEADYVGNVLNLGVFKPEQVKSAPANVGTYDTADTRTRYAVGFADIPEYDPNTRDYKTPLPERIRAYHFGNKRPDDKWNPRGPSYGSGEGYPGIAPLGKGTYFSSEKGLAEVYRKQAGPRPVMYEVLIDTSDMVSNAITSPKWKKLDEAIEKHAPEENKRVFWGKEPIPIKGIDELFDRVDRDTAYKILDDAGITGTYTQLPAGDEGYQDEISVFDPSVITTTHTERYAVHFPRGTFGQRRPVAGKSPIGYEDDKSVVGAKETVRGLQAAFSFMQYSVAKLKGDQAMKYEKHLQLLSKHPGYENYLTVALHNIGIGFANETDVWNRGSMAEDVDMEAVERELKELSWDATAEGGGEGEFFRHLILGDAPIPGALERERVVQETWGPLTKAFDAWSAEYKRQQGLDEVTEGDIKRLSDLQVAAENLSLKRKELEPAEYPEGHPLEGDPRNVTPMPSDEQFTDMAKLAARKGRWVNVTDPTSGKKVKEWRGETLEDVEKRLRAKWNSPSGPPVEYAYWRSRIDSPTEVPTHYLSDLKSRAPNAYKHFESWLNRSDKAQYKEQVEKAQGVVERYRNQNAHALARAERNPSGARTPEERSTWKEWTSWNFWEPFMEAYYRVYVDKNYFPTYLEKIVRRAGITFPDKPVLSDIHRFHYGMSVQRAEMAIVNGVFDPLPKEGELSVYGIADINDPTKMAGDGGQGLQAAFAELDEDDPNGDMENLEDYMEAQHTREQAAKKPNYHASMSPKVAQEILDEMDKEENRERKERYDLMAGKVRAWFHRLLEVRINYGATTQKDLDRIREAHEFYYPLMRTTDGKTHPFIDSYATTIQKKGPSSFLYYRTPRGSDAPHLTMRVAAMAQAVDTYKAIASHHVSRSMFEMYHSDLNPQLRIDALGRDIIPSSVTDFFQEDPGKTFNKEALEKGLLKRVDDGLLDPGDMEEILHATLVRDAIEEQTRIRRDELRSANLGLETAIETKDLTADEIAANKQQQAKNLEAMRTLAEQVHTSSALELLSDKSVEAAAKRAGASLSTLALTRMYDDAKLKDAYRLKYIEVEEGNVDKGYFLSLRKMLSDIVDRTDGDYEVQYQKGDARIFTNYVPDAHSMIDTAEEVPSLPGEAAQDGREMVRYSHVIDGKRLTALVDKRLIEAIQSEPLLLRNTAYRALAKLTHIRKGGAVYWNPSFMVMDWIRNTIQYAMASRERNPLNAIGAAMWWSSAMVNHKAYSVPGAPHNEAVDLFYQDAGKISGFYGELSQSHIKLNNTINATILKEKGKGLPLAKLFNRLEQMGVSSNPIASLKKHKASGWVASFDDLKSLVSMSDAAARIAEYYAVLQKHGYEIRKQSDGTSKLQKMEGGVWVDSRPNEKERIEAALAAREAVLDFMKQGRWGEHVNKVSMFWSAAVNASDKMLRIHVETLAATDVPGSGFAKMLTDKRRDPARLFKFYLGGMSLAYVYWSMVHDDEHYLELPDHVKNMYFVVPNGVGGYFYISKGYDAAHTFNAVEGALNAMHTEDKDAFAEAVWHTIDNNFHITPAHLTSPEHLGKQLGDLASSITAVGPLVEHFGDWDFFRGKAIEGRRLKDRQAAHRIKPDTLIASRALGALTGHEAFGSMAVSPVKFEHMANQWTGGMYKRWAKLVELATGDRKATLRDVPGLHTLIRPVGNYSRSLEQFYERDTKRVVEAHGSARDGFITMTPKIYDEWSHNRKFSSAISKLYKVIEDIHDPKERLARGGKYVVGMARQATGMPEKAKFPTIWRGYLPPEIAEVRDELLGSLIRNATNAPLKRSRDITFEEYLKNRQERVDSTRSSVTFLRKIGLSRSEITRRLKSFDRGSATYRNQFDNNWRKYGGG
jgi:hypothetical protein